MAMRLLIISFFTLLAMPLAAADLTLYSGSYGQTGYGLITEKRDVLLTDERTQITLTDLPETIEPNTLLLQPGPGVRVESQRYDYALANPNQLLQDHLGKTIIAERLSGEEIFATEGTLLSYEGGLLLQERNGDLTHLQRYDSIRYDAPVDRLATRPSFHARLRSGQTGSVPVRLTYEAGGLGWWMDYHAFFDADDRKLRLQALASLRNDTRKAFSNANVTLVAGEIARAKSAPRPTMMRAAVMSESMASADAAPSFSHGKLSDYHRYTLSTPATLPAHSQQQYALFDETTDIDAEKHYRFVGTRQRYHGGVQSNPNYGIEASAPVFAALHIDNTESNRLGRALPAGKWRIYSAGESPKLLGESALPHHPADKPLILPLGKAFDLSGERKQTAYNHDKARRVITETIAITLHNRSKEDVIITVEESLYRSGDWEITQSSHEYEKLDNQRITFGVKVDEGEASALTYTAQYRY